MTCYLSKPTFLPIFIALRQRTPEISVTNFCGQRKKKETANDMSPACLSACGDNQPQTGTTLHIVLFPGNKSERKF